jgi:hypothetical protein
MEEENASLLEKKSPLTNLFTSSNIKDETIAIIGGTGNTGKWCVKGCIQRGAKVKVLCRNPDKLKRIYATLWKAGENKMLTYDKVVTSGQLKIIKGNLPIGKKGEKVDGKNYTIAASDKQMDSLKQLVNGTTYVMSFLGMDPKNHAPICRPGIEAIMKAVQKSEGKQKPKIMIMSSIVLLDSYAQGKAAWGCCGCIGSFMRWKFLRLVFDDMEAAEQYAIENRSTMGLDVCLLRATVLGDKSNYYLDYTTTEPKYYIVKSDELNRVKMNIDRQHVVQCFLDAISDNKQTNNKNFSNCEWSLFDL